MLNLRTLGCRALRSFKLQSNQNTIMKLLFTLKMWFLKIVNLKIHQFSQNKDSKT